MKHDFVFKNETITIDYSREYPEIIVDKNSKAMIVTRDRKKSLCIPAFLKNKLNITE